MVVSSFCVFSLLFCLETLSRAPGTLSRAPGTRVWAVWDLPPFPPLTPLSKMRARVSKFGRHATPMRTPMRTPVSQNATQRTAVLVEKSVQTGGSTQSSQSSAGPSWSRTELDQTPVGQDLAKLWTIWQNSGQSLFATVRREQQAGGRVSKSSIQLFTNSKKANNTWSSQVVTHLSTNQARRCLTSEIGRDPVFSTWYGRKQ